MNSFDTHSKYGEEVISEVLLFADYYRRNQFRILTQFERIAVKECYQKIKELDLLRLNEKAVEGVMRKKKENRLLFEKITKLNNSVSFEISKRKSEKSLKEHEKHIKEKLRQFTENHRLKENTQ